MMKYAIFRDIPKASDIKIHCITCGAYKRSNPNARTTDWSFAHDLDSAIKKAKNLAQKYGMKSRDYKWCKPSDPKSWI